MCKRGDIYFVDFGKHKDSKKQQGIRPVVVVSNNKANTHSPVITVVPLTSKIHKKRFLPTHVYIPVSSGSGLNSASVALAEQVDSIDKIRLLEKRGHINSKSIMDKITMAIQVQVGVFEEFN
ncbi:type II toxin-antitoxin system PemK/MazF family toxin [Listeria innocua]|uniref:type II toxin-antitoxin system PemK/MazF family toxin n=1 Tax=Listeria innocua TaxID=1642 RepID=UPI0011C71774|nr:type II toxin-antitoxin system PemK/MazF family toxin [Listeria innocua]MBM5615095.1 type II toxin-antitoxin system PemK/MazF family toxin [Listeria innocua]MBM5683979.1 type II toxin-antitoxin system PemK/MazF family toxin [Listeria innocua]TXJ80165.1 type II toxin-antitoxin system PemK/MazF family toxin [Listeria innocua]HCJ4513456.1 type II toxin-antitoxin system PemK/MazF family toxin [Listeria innocua]HCJ4869519.1 type II toxin-antitoxin system PemK/MazF family toxin [Listeria innocua]